MCRSMLAACSRCIITKQQKYLHMLEANYSQNRGLPLFFPTDSGSQEGNLLTRKIYGFFSTQWINIYGCDIVDLDLPTQWIEFYRHSGSISMVQTQWINIYIPKGLISIIYVLLQILIHYVHQVCRFKTMAKQYCDLDF